MDQTPSPLAFKVHSQSSVELYHAHPLVNKHRLKWNRDRIQWNLLKYILYLCIYVNHDFRSFFSVKSLLWNAQFYLDFFVCAFASTIFGNTDLQDLHVLLLWAKDFKTKNLSCIKNSRIREFGMFVPNSAPTQWNAVKRGVFCLDVLRWSWLMKSSRVFVGSARTSARKSFCQEPSN